MNEVIDLFEFGLQVLYLQELLIESLADQLLPQYAPTSLVGARRR